ncbi:hypothetical protein [Sphingomonas bacterium]|uniref:hypothetical protein n=1 Tax=Sphingomonas bacterium TaxID=1895847 RepID=UPI002612494A|nr:hypothetical protein [Sphingomonas bacterium]MDB5678704.1 hypothetical protein [Sphingomonas bacterium]
MKRIFMLAALALGGCSMGQDLTSGGAAVDDFHRRMDAGQFAEIDAAAGPEIKATPGGFAPILSAVHAKLGNVKSSSRSGFNDRYDNGDHRLELVYDTKFDKGDGVEQFIYRLVDGKTVLIGYHVNSNALMTN